MTSVEVRSPGLAPFSHYIPQNSPVGLLAPSVVAPVVRSKLREVLKAVMHGSSETREHNAERLKSFVRIISVPCTPLATCPFWFLTLQIAAQAVQHMNEEQFSVPIIEYITSEVHLALKSQEHNVVMGGITVIGFKSSITTLCSIPHFYQIYC